MKNIVLFLIFILWAASANAQQTVMICQYVTSNGTTTCQPVSASNPLYITGSISSGVNLGTSATATNPSISGDLTSGFYTAGAGLVDTAISGVKIGEWSASGLTITGAEQSATVSIGTSTTTNKLTVYGNASIGTSYAGIAAPTNGLIVVGSTGIGTSAPSFPFDVVSSLATPAGAIETTGSNNALFVINNKAGGNQSGINLENGGTNIWQILMQLSTNVFTISNPVTGKNAMQINPSTDLIFIGATNSLRLPAGGGVGIGPNSSAPANILGVTAGVSIGSGYISTVAPTDGMIVAGKVGIGTSAPAYLLDMQDASATTPQFRDLETGATAAWGVFDSPASNQAGILMEHGGTIDWFSGRDGSSNYLLFDQANSKTILYGVRNSGVVVDGTSLVSGAALSVVGGISQTTAQSCATGVVTNAAGLFSGCVASDRKLKKDITYVDFDSSIIERLHPVTYKWVDQESRDNRTHGGFIAQDVKEVDPTCVESAGKDLLSVDSVCLAKDIVLDLQQVHRELAIDHGAFPFHKCFWGLLVCPE